MLAMSVIHEGCVSVAIVGAGRRKEMMWSRCSHETRDRMQGAAGERGASLTRRLSLKILLMPFNGLRLACRSGLVHGTIE